MADNDEIIIDVEVNEPQTIVCEVQMNSGEHNDLHGRDEEDCHPISSITGLEDALAAASGGSLSDYYTKEEVDELLENLPESGVTEEQLEAELNAHNTSLTAHPYLRQLIQNETTRAQSVEDTKVTKVDGKGLSTNDLTDELKEGYDLAAERSHLHANKPALNKITDGGDGQRLLADDGTYKTLSTNITDMTSETDDDVKMGQPVYIKENGHVGLAIANLFMSSKVCGLVKADQQKTLLANYINNRTLYMEDWSLVTGTTELVPSEYYYLSATDAGMLTNIAPIAIDSYVAKIGQALTSRTLQIEIEQPIKL